MRGGAYTIVVPTVGRPALTALLRRLRGTSADAVVVVDDRPVQDRPLDVPSGVVTASTGGGRGPAAARNVGWRLAATEWVVFVDDDVEPTPRWAADLDEDLQQDDDVAGIQGRVVVPVDGESPLTDWERNVAGLEGSQWITADMAYRRSALAEVGGFDERLRRAYREDSDLALRIVGPDRRLEMGSRVVWHPVGPAPWWVSVARQRGNADDVFMVRSHGEDWRSRSGAGTGMFRRHLFTTGSLLASLVAAAVHLPRVTAVTTSAWALSTARFAWHRIRPGPRSTSEVAAMIATSVVIPPAAVAWHLAGRWTHRQVGRRIDAVLFDRDGTLVVDVPYNGDPDAVVLVDGASEAIRRVRKAGLRVGMVSNQSGVGRGLLDEGQVVAVNRRLQELAGELDVVVWCPHDPDDGCECRKPAPGLIEEAARLLGTSPDRCVVVGDILSDVEAAEAAGATAILVPNAATKRDEVRKAPRVAATITSAVDSVLSWARRAP